VAFCFGEKEPSIRSLFLGELSRKVRKMHIPDGYLGPPTYLSLYAACVPFWIAASAKVKKGLKSIQVPFLALGAAFNFVIMMLNVPVPGGTTGHATGVPLVAILLGPWAAIITSSIALAIQALLFGDGGIMSLGANCFNMSIVGALVGYYLYRLFSWNSREDSKRRLVAAGLASYIAVNLGALLTAVEVGIQPLLHVGPDGRPLYSPFPLQITIPGIMIQHLAIFSFIEVVVTVLAMIYFQRSHPELLKGAAGFGRKVEPEGQP
jgi:cobalt/nickel transport system permease protein